MRYDWPQRLMPLPVGLARYPDEIRSTEIPSALAHYITHWKAAKRIGPECPCMHQGCAVRPTAATVRPAPAAAGGSTATGAAAGRRQ